MLFAAHLLFIFSSEARLPPASSIGARLPGLGCCRAHFLHLFNAGALLPIIFSHGADFQLFL